MRLLSQWVWWIICFPVFCKLKVVFQGKGKHFHEEKELDFVSHGSINEENNLFVQDYFDLKFQAHNTENGLINVPWINNVDNLHTSVSSWPVCYNGTSNPKEADDARLAHVICRQAGFMVATKWFGILSESIHLNSTGLSAYCRGDEQLVAHCQWKQLSLLPCSHFLAIECGDCSHSFMLEEDSKITIVSPGFPVFIPLVVCEWNITLSPENNLLIKFQQFELPSPVYDESINAISCRSGYLDVMSWHEDIFKMALDGRFCGRYSPGNLTILSNRILIRFTAGSFKVDAIAKKGFLAECSLVPQVQFGHVSVVRWVLIGCAILFTVAITLFLLIWRRSFLKFCRRFFNCWWRSSGTITEDHPALAVSSLAVRLPSPAAPFSSVSSELQESQMESKYQRRRSELKFPIQNCDSRHWDQIRRLEKWRSTRQKTHYPSTGLLSLRITENKNCLKKEISGASSNATNEDENHIYEEIDIGLQQEKQSSNCTGLTFSNPGSATVSPTRMSFVSQNLLYEPVSFVSYQSPVQSGETASVLVSVSQGISLHQPSSVENLVTRSVQHRIRSILSTPTYFPPSSISGESASLSAIYVNPESYSEE